MMDATLTREELEAVANRSGCRTYRVLGAHPARGKGGAGVRFAVVAPNAGRVSVIGEFNGWDPEKHPMQSTDHGVWQTFIPGIKPGARYKFRVVSRDETFRADKADPYAFFAEVPPETASRVLAPPSYQWQDHSWMEARAAAKIHDTPMSIYEVHLGSWRRVPEAGNRSLTYREAADQLVEYVAGQGFTHVEFLPLAEHPFYGSWGYQVTGYYAPLPGCGPPGTTKFPRKALCRTGRSDRARRSSPRVVSRDPAGDDSRYPHNRVPSV
jgi:1,4-alpha-glucan branching enzyme